MYGSYLNICNDGETGLPKSVWLDNLESTVNFVNANGGTYPWNNEISSWKCGRNVGIKLCYGTDSGDDASDTECPGDIT